MAMPEEIGVNCGAKMEARSNSSGTPHANAMKRSRATGSHKRARSLDGDAREQMHANRRQQGGDDRLFV